MYYVAKKTKPELTYKTLMDEWQKINFKTIVVKTKKELEGVSFKWHGKKHYLPYNYHEVTIPVAYKPNYFNNVT